MARKSSNTIASMLSLNKIQKKISFLLKPKNLNKVLFLVGILLVLYMLHRHFLNKEGMTSISHENFDETIGEKKTAVLFHANWCGHCKKFMPTWEKVSSEVDETSPVVLASFDCSESSEDKNVQEVMKKYNVKGFPSVLLFENGEIKEFEQERNESNLKSFLGL
jgi:protein disulfide-isomerase-like protein